MIGRGGRALILLYAVLLAVLFLMCSTDLVIREPEKEIYQIAVIIEDDRGDNYSNFRKGMDQAAMEFNADVHFITLYEKLDADQQLELMEREQQDGADALIVVPADEGRVSGKHAAVPVIFLYPGFAENTGAGSIVTDYRKMGEELAREMLQGAAKECTVLELIDTDSMGDMDGFFLEGAEEVLAAAGYNSRAVAVQGQDGIRAALEGLKEEDRGEALVLAQNPEILAETAAAMTDNPDLAEHVGGLYGRGSTLPILNYLDRGQITGICVTDGFSTGYLSVLAAVRTLEGDGAQEPVVMESYYIEKKDLRDPACEKLLYPIE